MIKEIIDSTEYGHKSSGKFSISGVGGCWRKKYLELKGLFKAEFDYKAIRTFAIGDAFHRMIVKEIMEKGEGAGMHVAAAEVNIPEAHSDAKYLSGRADLIVSDSKRGILFVVDVKSCSDWTLKKVKSGDVPQNYIDQVNMYCHFFGLKEGYLVFVSKHKGEVAEHKVVYDQARAKQILADVENFYKNFVEKNIEPPACDGITSPFGCDACSPKYGKQITIKKAANGKASGNGNVFDIDEEL